MQDTPHLYSNRFIAVVCAFIGTMFGVLMFIGLTHCEPARCPQPAGQPVTWQDEHPAHAERSAEIPAYVEGIALRYNHGEPVNVSDLGILSHWMEQNPGEWNKWCAEQRRASVRYLGHAHNGDLLEAAPFNPDH